MGKLGTLTHPLNYRILHKINKKDSSYSTEISRVLKKDQGNIAKRISSLYEKNLIKKGKRTKAQHYEVSFEGLYYEFLEICVALWEGLDKDSGKPQFAYDELESEELDNELLYGFYRDYLGFYLENNSEGTIREMLLEDFFNGLEVAVDVEEDLPEDGFPASPSNFQHILV